MTDPRPEGALYWRDLWRSASPHGLNILTDPHGVSRAPQIAGLGRF